MDKKFLLEESKSFCMLPWVHVHQTPDNDIGGCCIGTHFGNPQVAHTVEDLINNDILKQMRKDMLNEEFNPLCHVCHNHEKVMGWSNRKESNELWAHRFDDSVPLTEEDGHLNDFKMSYFDIRFRNTCNMKCRSCGPGYSSLWQAEAIKYPMIIEYQDISGMTGVSEPDLIDDVIKTQAHNFERLWFAGGEPLIHDEHYKILEHLISIGKTDVIITYSTNLTTLKYRDKDVFDLWKHFKQVDVHASIDSWGDRAEVLRKGTKWPDILENLRKIVKYGQEHFNVTCHFSCVVSIMNYLTLADLMQYLIDEKIWVPCNMQFKQSYMEFFPLNGPTWMNAQNLPVELKREGFAKLQEFSRRFHKMNQIWDGYNLDQHITSITQYVNTPGSKDLSDFFSYNSMFDEIRKEDTRATFPELESLFKAREIELINL